MRFIILAHVIRQSLCSEPCGWLCRSVSSHLPLCEN